MKNVHWFVIAIAIVATCFCGAWLTVSNNSTSDTNVTPVDSVVEAPVVDTLTEATELVNDSVIMADSVSVDSLVTE